MGGTWKVSRGKNSIDDDVHAEIGEVKKGESIFIRKESKEKLENLRKNKMYRGRQSTQSRI